MQCQIPREVWRRKGAGFQAPIDAGEAHCGQATHAQHLRVRSCFSSRR